MNSRGARVGAGISDIKLIVAGFRLPVPDATSSLANRSSGQIGDGCKGLGRSDSYSDYRASKLSLSAPVIAHPVARTLRTCLTGRSSSSLGTPTRTPTTVGLRLSGLYQERMHLSVDGAPAYDFPFIINRRRELEVPG